MLSLTTWGNSSSILPQTYDNAAYSQSPPTDTTVGFLRLISSGSLQSMTLKFGGRVSLSGLQCCR